MIGPRVVAALAVVTVSSGAAVAGGLERPASVGARAVGQGGAFCAIADDATAWQWNPGAAALAAPSVTVGGELVIAPRSYVPIDASGARGATQAPDTPIAGLPVLGVAVRVGDRVTVGAGLWNTYGGKLSYPRTGAPAIDASQEAVVEVVGGVAYRVTPRLAVGATARLGVGLFAVHATDRPVTSDLSGFGVGVGLGFGVAWRPHPRLALGVTWRSALTVDTTGTGTLAIGAGQTLDMVHTQRWPQAVELGAAVAVTPTVRVAAQLDWTGWSSFEQLEVRFPAQPSVDQRYDLDWRDSVTGRLGLEWRARPAVAVRAGAYVDGNAVPDRTLERQYLDTTKVGGAVGGGLRVGAWRVDAALDVLAGPPRIVPDNAADVGGFPGRANLAPGEHDGQVVTFELAVGRRI
ncbi:MAG: outer membrane protein transport protein [Kofleriaceae bacterium]